MFSKVLVANRGEIALRVIRACREMGIGTVAVYSKADAEALHVRFADEAICIGPAPARDSYLNIRNLIGAAEVTGADAIHPGYGFLAENAQFAEMCADTGINFIGPAPETITKMGDKALARQTMIEAGVPVIPGSETILQNEVHALSEADRIGFPILLKATAGGGGKGMRIVRSKEELNRSFGLARVEAETNFRNGSLYMERYLDGPRHIEVQVMGYADGTVHTYGERDCSIQRRHQKLIEESPSPAIVEEIRNELCRAAVKACQAVHYLGAGTLEFLYSEGNFFFMEMNTRIQVEHPISEMVFNTDLLKEQIRASAGEDAPGTTPVMRGHAIECRINAENPDLGFAPSPGKISAMHVPGGLGVRVDTHAYSGYTIPPDYDSLIAKLISFGRDRNEAISRMGRALDEFVVEGVFTTIPLHREIVESDDFTGGHYDTTFLEKHLERKREASIH